MSNNKNNKIPSSTAQDFVERAAGAFNALAGECRACVDDSHAAATIERASKSFAGRTDPLLLRSQRCLGDKVQTSVDLLQQRITLIAELMADNVPQVGDMVKLERLIASVPSLDDLNPAFDQ